MDSIYTTIITIIEGVCGALFMYQMVYMVIALIKKAPVFTARSYCKYAILISAKDEENVIGKLIESILAQDYPKELFRIFVVADNCSDRTAETARQAGATVYERFSQKKRGKGYALRFLFKQIDRDFGIDSFDGYMVFDADNLLAPNYITEINKVFSNGYRICTSYRNSKNYGSNWLTSNTGLWFLREARHLNHARMLLNVSCMVSGTGYVMHRDIVKRNGGWKFFLLTEDVDFSVDSILHDEKIGYCEQAVFYDEQPTRFMDSWNQRLRWAKGFYQVLYKNFGKLVKRMFVKHDFACFDALVILSPGHIFLAACTSVALLTAANVNWDPNAFTFAILNLVWPLLLGAYATFVLMGFLVLITEYKKIYCSKARIFLLLLTFPAFMITYIPIAIVALFAPVKWKPIKHTFAMDNQAMENQQTK